MYHCEILPTYHHIHQLFTLYAIIAILQHEKEIQKWRRNLDSVLPQYSPSNNYNTLANVLRTEVWENLKVYI